MDYLRQLVAEISSPQEEIPDEEDRKIKEAIEEIERQHNSRDEARKIFRIADEVRASNGRRVATVDATINFKTDPARIDTEKEAVLLAFVIKGREITLEARLLGDIDLAALKNLQLTMPGLSKAKRPVPMAKPTTVTKAMEKTEPTVDETNVPMGEVMEPKISPMETEEAEPEPSASSTPEMRLTKGTRKKVYSYQKKAKSPSESSEETTVEETSDSPDEEEVKEKKKKRPAKSKQKTSTKTKDALDRAKDGRKKIDLSNRIRDVVTGHVRK